jgi:protein phosphatase 1L
LQLKRILLLIRGKKEIAMIREGSILRAKKKYKGLLSSLENPKEIKIDPENQKSKSWWKKFKENKEEKYYFYSDDSNPSSRELTPPDTPREECIPESNSWLMTSTEKEQYTRDFKTIDTNQEGYISIEQSKKIFPNLSNDILAKIWSLSDVDEDRRLDADEFCIAKFLEKMKQRGENLPFILTETFLISVNPVFLSYRKTSYEEEDLEKLQSSRTRRNAFYCGPVEPIKEFFNVNLPSKSTSALVNPTIEPKIFSFGERVKCQSSRLKIGYADTIGRRSHMEDEIVVCGYLGGKENEDFIAVFDGHGGREAAEYASQKLYQILAEKIKSNCTPDVSLKTSFLETNNLMKKENIKGGTTALCALFIGDYGYIANSGDSRAVLCDNGLAIRYSTDHKPDVPEEEKRIRELGGSITTSIDRVGKVTSRLCGRLAVSRALGDFIFEPYICAEPEVRGPINISKKSSDFFLILACDGLWDRVTDEEAIEIVSPILDPEKAAIALRNLAYCEGSDDNISVVVVRFPSFPE